VLSVWLLLHGMLRHCGDHGHGRMVLLEPGSDRVQVHALLCNACSGPIPPEPRNPQYGGAAPCTPAHPARAGTVRAVARQEKGRKATAASACRCCSERPGPLRGPCCGCRCRCGACCVGKERSERGDVRVDGRAICRRPRYRVDSAPMPMTQGRDFQPHNHGLPLLAAACAT